MKRSTEENKVALQVHLFAFCSIKYWFQLIQISQPLPVCVTLFNHVKINFQIAMALSSHLLLQVITYPPIQSRFLWVTVRSFPWSKRFPGSKRFSGPHRLLFFFCLCFLWEVYGLWVLSEAFIYYLGRQKSCVW